MVSNNVDMSELFGEDESSSDEEMQEQKVEPKTTDKNESTTTTQQQPHALEDSEEEADTQLNTYNPLTGGSRHKSREKKDENAKETPPARELTMLNIPKVSVLAGAKSGLNINNEEKKIKFYVSKLPNILGIQSQCFDKERYDGDEEEKSYKGYTHNIIRWRYKKDATGELLRDAQGDLVRESNARFIKVRILHAAGILSVIWNDSLFVRRQVCKTTLSLTAPVMYVRSNSFPTALCIFRSVTNVLRSILIPQIIAMCISAKEHAQQLDKM